MLCKRDYFLIVTKTLQNVKAFFWCFIKKFVLDDGMKKILFCAVLIFFFFADFVFGQYIISFLPNPEGDDNNKEFVEIYAPSLNITGYIIGDNVNNDTLVNIFYTESNTALIGEEDFNFREKNISFYSAGAAIGNGLGNTGDSIFLYAPNGTLLTSVTYNETIEAKIYYLNKTQEDENPAEQNERVEESEELINIISLSSVLPSFIYLNQSFTKGFSIKNLGSEKVDVLLGYTVLFNNTVFINESLVFLNISRSKTSDTIEVTFFYEGNYTICGIATVLSSYDESDFSDNTLCQNATVIDLSDVLCDRNLSIILNQTHIKNKQQLAFSFLVDGDYASEDVPFTLSYVISEYSGDIAKKPVTTSTTSKKHWTPDITTQYGLFTLDATLTETTCLDTTLENNKASVFIVVDGTLEEEASATIEHIYLGTDGIAKTGDTLMVKVTVYSGNLSRISKEEKGITLFVKNIHGTIVSKTTELSFHESFDKNTITVPVLLDYSCTTFPIVEEYYTLVVQSAGNTAKEKFPVRGVNTERCSDASSSEIYSASFTEIAYAFQNITQNVTLRNIDDATHIYKISSKIYRGSKTYSGDFFENKQEHTLNPGEERIIYLENTVPDISSGTYKIKITIEKDQQKTTREITHDIIILDAFLDNETLQNSATINSFFVVEQEIDMEMTVFAEIYGIGNYSLVMESIVERNEIEIMLNSTAYLFFNMSVQKGKNILVLTLYNNKELIDSVPLIVFVGNHNESVSYSTSPNGRSSLAAITGNTITIPLGLSHIYYKSLSYIHGIVLFFLFIFIIILVNQKLFKTSIVSLFGDKSNQSTSDYRDARGAERTHSRDAQVVHR